MPNIQAFNECVIPKTVRSLQRGEGSGVERLRSRSQPGVVQNSTCTSPKTKTPGP